MLNNENENENENENKKPPKKQNSSSNEVKINNVKNLKSEIGSINLNHKSIAKKISDIKNAYDSAVSNFKAKKAKTWLYANTKNVDNFKAIEAETESAAKELSGKLIKLSSRINKIIASINTKLKLEKSQKNKSVTVVELDNLLIKAKSINSQVEKLKTSATKLERRQYRFFA